MASPAPSGRLQYAIKYYQKVRKTGPKCRKRLITRKCCDIRQKISVLQRQRRPQISRVKNIGRAFELSGVAFRLVPPYGGLCVELFSWFQSKRVSPRPTLLTKYITNTALHLQGYKLPQSADRFVKWTTRGLIIAPWPIPCTSFTYLSAICIKIAKFKLHLQRYKHTRFVFGVALIVRVQYFKAISDF